MSDPKLPEGIKPLYAEEDVYIGSKLDFEIEPFERVQDWRKRQGRCVHCGEKLNMRWTGLDDCEVCTNEKSER